MYLMLKDTEILYFDLDDCIVNVIRNDLLPFCLRANIRCPTDMKNILHNIQVVKSYLSSRVLSLSRDNAKQIYAAFQIPQLDSIDNRVDICIGCKGVSIQDSYWVKKDNETVNWENINIRQNELSDIIDLSLTGFSPSITTNSICPELTTKGLYRKGWIRINKTLYMLKSDKTNDYVNTKMEVLASDILNCFQNKLESITYVSDIKYTQNGRKSFVSICKNFVEERYSFVEAWEVIDYCKRLNIDFRNDCLERWGNLFACIPVLDYIIINTDRHTQNYGFLMDNDTGKIEKIAPLFDFNCALVADYFKIDAGDTLSQMFNTAETLRGLAVKYLEYTDLQFNEELFTKLAKQRKNKKYYYIFEMVYGRIQEMGIV